MATVPAFADIRDTYASQWAAMKIDDANRGLFNSVASRLYKNIGIYRSIERTTGVPATFIAVAHERESGGDLGTYLGNGEPLSMVTKLVPKGRGPFGSFSEGAIDALRYEGLDKIRDWSLERMLYCLEAYNGWGYFMFHNMPSPYIWARTSIAQRGKYVADGKFDPTIMDVQVGCAGIIAALWAIDPTLRLQQTSDVVVPRPRPEAPEISLDPAPVDPPKPRPVPPPAPPPSTVTPAQQGILAALAAIAGGLLVFGHQIADWFHRLIGG